MCGQVSRSPGTPFAWRRPAPWERIIGMPHWLPDWRSALITAVLLLAAGSLLRRRQRRSAAVGPFLSEAGVVAALYAMWQIAGILSTAHMGDAYGRARWIWHTERAVHLPSEVSVQRLVEHHANLVHGIDAYYIYAHYNGLIILLIWLFAFHRRDYPRIRNTAAAFTGICLLVHLMPTAPPRVLPEFGFVDTAMVYGDSVYAGTANGVTDSLSALPSVHVGWAILVAVAAISVSRSR